MWLFTGGWHQHPCGIEVTTELTCLAWQSLGALISLAAASGVAPDGGTASRGCLCALKSSEIPKLLPLGLHRMIRQALGEGSRGAFTGDVPTRGSGALSFPFEISIGTRSQGKAESGAATGTSAGEAKQRQRLKGIALLDDENSALKETLNRCQPVLACQQPEPRKERGGKPPQMSPALEKSSFPCCSKNGVRASSSRACWSGRVGKGRGRTGTRSQLAAKLGGYIPSSSSRITSLSLLPLFLPQFVFFPLFI